MLLHVISGLKIGGAEFILYELVESLQSEFEQFVICFHDGAYRQKIEALGVPVYHITGGLTCYDPLFFWRLYRLIRQLNPTVMHTSLWAANFCGRLFSKFMKIPVVCAIHQVIDHNGSFRTMLDWPTFNHAHKIIAVSSTIHDSLKKRSPVNPAKICLIDNGINVNKTITKSRASVIERSCFNLSPDHFIIGAVGRLVPIKNFSLLLASFAELSATHQQVRLILVGSGPDEQALKQLAVDLSIADKIFFITGNQDALPYYRLFDCFVLPSRTEGLSIALLEALCFSLPCIVTGKGDHPVISSGINGIVIEPNNLVALTTALESLITNKPRGTELGARGYSTVTQEYDSSTMTAGYKSLFLELIRSL